MSKLLKGSPLPSKSHWVQDKGLIVLTGPQLLVILQKLLSRCKCQLLPQPTVLLLL